MKHSELKQLTQMLSGTFEDFNLALEIINSMELSPKERKFLQKNLGKNRKEEIIWRKSPLGKGLVFNDNCIFGFGGEFNFNSLHSPHKKNLSLPEHLEFKKNLDLRCVKINSLPKNLKIGGNLYMFALEQLNPTKVYGGLRVGGNFYIGHLSFGHLSFESPPSLNLMSIDINLNRSFPGVKGYIYSNVEMKP